MSKKASEKITKMRNELLANQQAIKLYQTDFANSSGNTSDYLIKMVNDSI